MPNPKTLFRPSYDAVVVGARCAGAATAMLLARAGLDVLVVDRGQEGADTVSTHALMRGAVLQLHRWGLLGAVVEAGTPAVRTATFHYGDEAVPVAIKPRDGIDALYAPRRTVLDPLLVRAAEVAGARVVHGVAAVDLVRDARGRVRGVVLAGPGDVRATVSSRIVIGADGIRSRVAALAGAEVLRSARHAGAGAYVHWDGLAVEGYHWYYRPGVSAGAIPTNDGRTCVFVETSAARWRDLVSTGVEALYHRLLAEAAPGVAAAVAGARAERKPWTFPSTPGFLRRPWGPGWALAGDAGYFKDPITAHGITDALRDAELLARAVVAGTDAALAGYQAERDELSIGLFEVTDRVASFEWDLGQAREDHRQLARLMAAEVDALVAIDRGTARPESSPRDGVARRIASAA